MVKRVVKRPVGNGAAKAAPSASQGAGEAVKTGGIKKRTTIPVLDAEMPELPGELGVFVKAATKNNAGIIASPFRVGSQKIVEAGYVRTGVLSTDLALGGGWRLSRGCMLYGERSAGKTTKALKTVARIQRQFPDKYAAWIDIEGTLDLAWAAKLGVDLERLFIVEPDSGEEAVDYAQALISTMNVSIVVTDSIAMLVPMKEIDSVAEQDLPGLQARLVGKFLRKANTAMLKERKRQHYPLVMHINQFRMKIGLVFGDPRTLPGGKALEFATTQQLEVRNKEHKADKGDYKGFVIYNEHNVVVTKNKSGGPLKEAMFKLVRTPDAYEDGSMPEAFIDQAATVRTLGLKCGVFTGNNTVVHHDDYGKFGSAADITRFAIHEPDKYDKILADITLAFQRRWGIL